MFELNLPRRPAILLEAHPFSACELRTRLRKLALERLLLLAEGPDRWRSVHKPDRSGLDGDLWHLSLLLQCASYDPDTKERKV